MELFLIRFLCGATLLLIAGILGAVLLRRRGPAVACAVLRAAQVGLVLCAIVAALPSPVRPITAIAPPEIAAETLAEESPSQGIEAPTGQIILTESSFAPAESTATTAPGVKSLPWQNIALGVWAIGGLIGLGRLLIGHVMLHRLRRNSQLVDLGQIYPVELRESSAIPTPLLAGCVQSVLYLPQTGLLRESPEALQMILAHELAHHKRHDLAWSLSAQLLRVLLWFHPLIHVLANQQELFAEQASDEVALQQLPGRQAYARLLLTLSELTAPRYPRLTMSMASGHSRVGQRIKHLLSAPLSLPLSLRGRTGIAVVTLGVLVTGTALIGYAQKPPVKNNEVLTRRTGKYWNRVESISVKNRPLTEVVAEVSRQTQYPIKIAPNLTGNITLSVKGKECADVLKEICAQVRPAAWVVIRPVAGRVGYALLPLPPVGKFSGQVVNSDGKPVAGVQVRYSPYPDDSHKEIPAALRFNDAVSTDAQGKFVLSRIGKYPYVIQVEPDFESGFLQVNFTARGVPGQTTALPGVRLIKGARLDIQFANENTYKSLRATRTIRYSTEAVKDQTAKFLVAPGETHFVARESISSYRVRSYSGAGKWQLQKGVLSVSLKAGEHARLVIDAELTPKEKQRRLRHQKDIEQETYLYRVNMKAIQMPAEPRAFQDVVKAMCKQAGLAQLRIDPGIGGIVKPRKGGFFERMIQDVCLQATPMAFPVWEGTTLHIVRAPERGQFDKKNRLYRLMGSTREFVFQEKDGRYGTGGSADIAHNYARKAGTASITVTYGIKGKPAAGITVAHETYGKVRKVQTDSQGRCMLPSIPGQNYYYPILPKGWIVNGAQYRGSSQYSSYVGSSRQIELKFGIVASPSHPRPL